MTCSYVPMVGFLRQTVKIKDSEIVGKCIASFWPQCGHPGEITVTLRSSSGENYTVPLHMVEEVANA